jgi:hypothetical protein
MKGPPFPHMLCKLFQGPLELSRGGNGRRDNATDKGGEGGKRWEVIREKRRGRKEGGKGQGRLQEGGNGKER